jgi:hypothetical protein
MKELTWPTHSFSEAQIPKSRKTSPTKETMMNSSSTAGLKRSSVSSLNLSQLSLAESDCSGTSTANLRRGWGSAESRKAYADLTILQRQHQPQHKQVTSRVPSQDDMNNGADSWGYFVDTPDRNWEHHARWQ